MLWPEKFPRKLLLYLTVQSNLVKSWFSCELNGRLYPEFLFPSFSSIIAMVLFSEVMIDLEQITNILTYIVMENYAPTKWLGAMLLKTVAHNTKLVWPLFCLEFRLHGLVFKIENFFKKQNYDEITVIKLTVSTETNIQTSLDVIFTAHV